MGGNDEKLLPGSGLDMCRTGCVDDFAERHRSVPSLGGGLAGDGRPRCPAHGDQARGKSLSGLVIVMATMLR